MITIREKDFGSFFDAPFQAYGPNSLYVSPMKSDLKAILSPKDNPLFNEKSKLTWFTAHRDGRVCGRITAHAHAESNAVFSTNQAYFGFFDCENDQEVGKELLAAAECWAQRHGFHSIAGNYNLTAMQQIGVMISGFDKPPYTDLIYSPPHIKELLQASGYKPEFPMTTFETVFDGNYAPMELGPKQKDILENPDFEFAPVNRKTIQERLEDARKILNASFAQNPQFLEVTKAEYDFQSRDMKWIMDPRISAILHYKKKPAACIICIPDVNPLLKATRSRFGLSFLGHFIRHRLNKRRAVLIYSGVIPEFQGQGVNPLVLWKVTHAMRDVGYEVCGNTWIGSENKASLRQKEKMGAQPLHQLSIYRKQLASL